MKVITPNTTPNTVAIITPSPEDMSKAIAVRRAANAELLTIEQWHGSIMSELAPDFGAVCEAKPRLIDSGLGIANTKLAIIAYRANSSDLVRGLPCSIQALAQFSLRTLRMEIDRLEAAKDPRSGVLSGVYDAGLAERIRLLAKVYLRADTAKLTDAELALTIDAIVKVVRTRFASLSSDEIEAAFEAAAFAGKLSYGAFDVQLVMSVLNAYLERRNVALSAYLAEETAQKAAREKAENIEQLNEAAYVKAVSDFARHAVSNTEFSSFWQCPHLYTRRLIDDGYLELVGVSKTELWDKARAYLLYNMQQGAKTPEHKKKVDFILSKVGITPMAAPKLDSGLLKAATSQFMGFNYEVRTEKAALEAFNEMAALYYQKLVYFHGIATYTNPKQPINPSIMSIINEQRQSNESQSNEKV